MRRSTSASGFTLLEIAIAMGVLGVAVVSALQVFGSAMQLARRAARKSEAVVHARTLMDEVLWQPELGKAGSQGATEDGYRWERQIWPAGADDGIDVTDPMAEQSDLRLAVVKVVVSWDEPTGPNSYEIKTMRVVPSNE